MDFKKLLEDEKYNFLKTNPNLKGRILFLVLSGSYSYGTNVETSDIDIRGVCLDSISDLVGLTSFEQYTDSETDTVIYSLSKFINLAIACNPNIIEMLFANKEHYLYVSPLGQLLLDNKDLFLSKKAIYTFKGFANAQMNRLENALLKKENADLKFINTHIARSTNNVVLNFNKRNNLPSDSIKTYLSKDNEILVDFNIKEYPLDQLYKVVEQMSNVLKGYNRNIKKEENKKDNLHINKLMMHYVRCFLVLEELLTTNTFHTYRKDDRKLLLDIRNGKYRDENGILKEGFNLLINDIISRCEEKEKTTSLKEKVDISKINELVTYIYKEGLKDEKL